MNELKIALAGDDNKIAAMSGTKKTPQKIGEITSAVMEKIAQK